MIASYFGPFLLTLLYLFIFVGLIVIFRMLWDSPEILFPALKRRRQDSEFTETTPPDCPFRIGQKIYCHTTCYNHKAGEEYTVRSAFRSIDRTKWFIRLEEVAVSTSTDFFVPLNRKSEFV